MLCRVGGRKFQQGTATAHCEGGRHPQLEAFCARHDAGKELMLQNMSAWKQGSFIGAGARLGATPLAMRAVLAGQSVAQSDIAKFTRTWATPLRAHAHADGAVAGVASATLSSQRPAGNARGELSDGSLRAHRWRHQPAVAHQSPPPTCGYYFAELPMPSLHDLAS